MGIYKSIVNYVERSDKLNPIRIQNQTRIGFSILSPVIIVIGIIYLLVYSGVYIDGEWFLPLMNNNEANGGNQIHQSILFIILGVVMGLLRITIFRKKRIYSDNIS